MIGTRENGLWRISINGQTCYGTTFWGAFGRARMKAGVPR
jgi:hypothetical protein